MPGSISDTLFSANSTVIKELIGENVELLMPEIDPTFRDMILSSMTVEDASNRIGRDWKIKRRFMSGLAGVIEGGNQSNFFNMVGDTTTAYGNKLLTHALNETWPDPTQGRSQAPIEMAMTLYSINTNLMLTLGMLQAEAIPANIKEYVMPILTGFAKNIALWMANSWHADPENEFRLASFDGASATWNNTTKRLAFTPTENTTHKFFVGQELDCFFEDIGTGGPILVNAEGTGASATRSPCFVDSVDYWTGEVTLQFGASNVDLTAGFSIAIADADGAFVTNARTKGGTNTVPTFTKGFYAWKSFAVHGGTPAAASSKILKNLADSSEFIDVTVHPEFRSGVFQSVGELTETKLLQYLEASERALSPFGWYLDTILAPEGVWLNMFDSRQSMEQIDRTGRPGSLNSLGLAEGFSITSQGRTYQGYTSRFMNSGEVLAFRRQNNWKILTPPDPSGVTRSSLPGREGQDAKFPFTFVGGALQGNGQDKMPLYATATPQNGSATVTLPTEGVQMPGMLRCQMVPEEQIPMMVLTGVNDTRVTSATV